MKVSPRLASVNILLALLFAAFAWVQLNDIDPEIYYEPSVLDAALWFLFYLIIAVLFVVAVFLRIPRWLLVVAALACLVEMVRSGPGLYENLVGEGTFTMTQVSMSAEDPRVELSREFFGALFALAGVGFLYLQGKGGRKGLRG